MITYFENHVDTRADRRDNATAAIPARREPPGWIWLPFFLFVAVDAILKRCVRKKSILDPGHGCVEDCPVIVAGRLLECTCRIYSMRLSFRTNTKVIQGEKDRQEKIAFDSSGTSLNATPNRISRQSYRIFRVDSSDFSIG